MGQIHETSEWVDLIKLMSNTQKMTSLAFLLYIYIFGVFTEKPYSKPLERNVVYIPIITLSHATSRDFK